MTLGDRIRRAREAKKWSLQRLADEMNVSKQAVFQWEKNDSDARKHIEALSRLLEVPVDYFYGSRRSPNVLAAKIGQLPSEQQEQLEAMIDTMLRQVVQEPDRKPTVK